MSSDKTIPLGEYLFQRIKSLGVSHILGCPGDFNLTLLDYIYNVPDLKWVGCCNELNGAYAADGYARVRGLPAALVTTYGVGELSAMNGVAGAYAEHAGMIHIVGNTARALQKNKIMIHHTLKADPDHEVYQRMAEPIAAATTFLVDEATMASEIDRVIIECIKTKLPVYIFIPTDVVDTPLDATRLDTPLDTKIVNEKSEVEDLVVKKVLEAIKNAKNPCILADVLANRHNARDLVRKLSDLSQYPSFSTILSKGIIDETSPTFHGLYNGSMSLPGIKDKVEKKSDLVINIGPHLSSSNTGSFTREIKEENLIVLHPHYCSVQGEKYDGVHFMPVIEKIVAEFEKEASTYKKGLELEPYKIPTLDNTTSGPIKQSYIWQRIGRWTKPNDLIFVEAGTAQFGMPDAPLAKNCQSETQILWSSIGYTVGGLLGGLIAHREAKTDGRVILVVGDGSLQMTVQEIGTYIRNGFTPTIFLINNDGYTIEREIHGPEQQYNDISPMWDYQRMLEFFGGRQPGFKSKSYQAKTVEELEDILTNDEFVRSEYIQLVEIFLPKFDVPWILRGQVDLYKGRLKAQAAEKEEERKAKA